MKKNLPVAFNNVDLCLKVRVAGYRNRSTPSAQLFHHESAIRGHDDSHKKLQRFDTEIQSMKKMAGEAPARP
jgi:GT2 family glycosyltransferase